MRLFLDTNVLIDYYARRPPFFEAWLQLRVAQVLGDVELWTSAKSFTDVFYVMSRVCDSHELQRAMLESLSFLKVCAIDGQDIASAARASWDDFEDCLVDIAARKVAAEVILTRDATGFARSKLRIMSPFEYLDWMRNENHVEYAQVEVGGQLWSYGLFRTEGPAVPL